ncbi:MAG TPA: TIGR00730 family Rossman fold protein [Gemmataceae bacterium]|jgi:hypothetical protein|nr:TIGR00730 family Rossman fold protein [Gemmataceae bacterium]
MQSVCVFCGSSLGANAVYREAAAALGREIARRNLRLIYGGGNVGLMGVVADAALAVGGEVLGVIPRALEAREVAHGVLTELIVVETMHDRKAKMADVADGFIALPGGYGTFEEFCEVLTWTQLGIQAKPCGLLNVNGYYDPLLALFDRAATEVVLRSGLRALLLVDTTAAGLLDTLTGWVPVPTEKWLNSDQT